MSQQDHTYVLWSHFQFPSFCTIQSPPHQVFQSEYVTTVYMEPFYICISLKEQFERMYHWPIGPRGKLGIEIRLLWECGIAEEDNIECTEWIRTPLAKRYMQFGVRSLFSCFLSHLVRIISHDLWSLFYFMYSMLSLYYDLIFIAKLASYHDFIPKEVYPIHWQPSLQPPQQ